ncbi:MAG: bifunctional diaminohydroxyphosphoribosylaminopyrimidine deaminase/5-amino-6-(5-phosphoribosylamino)uracil reductase RibD [Saprospiraceae bacterium]|nr:bifunctional diaminohydroxyphosphoribosylaminopyrimidine deaminase/5-amino-6-(5-phosphoribosylamino)uracil reductase RibD [Saprospiraceae bacterium]MCF8249340.1 bifunctional diaminohydroxyphosphoribosylaminopyrimidine deaminase/5-amino-6-(5-phosphoribosylamino)uracil reductase RibD [Saprospiraceae bacterium]MCF8311383.1 bifunctional diaminohydroxyphosphoribosylaminopyrimidine deaminase/5-amino-6-(5-phosphoribosylamino)uracil reductase RibD [Saprospiraceae bacterium]MCF8439959.1 bifunctional d
MTDEIFMRRCFDLARLGSGSVSPNPMVGAVLVHDGRVIGEGWHQRYGEPHAEVRCLASVSKADQLLISQSTLYVSLEPCCFHGKTPACTDLILREQIPKVVIASLDETPEVAGKGVKILRQSGVEVVSGVCGSQPNLPSDVRNVFVSQKRPFIQLKFAKSIDGYMGKAGRQVWFSNHYSQVLAHKGRGAFDAILIGTNTALTDDPSLTTRHWFGKSPLRIVLDRRRILPGSLKLFDNSAPALVVTERRLPSDKPSGTLQFVELDFDDGLLVNLMDYLFEHQVSSIIVEGGADTISRFLEINIWDEAAIFTTPLRLGKGILAPTPLGKQVMSYQLGSDNLTILSNEHQGR